MSSTNLWYECRIYDHHRLASPPKRDSWSLKDFSGAQCAPVKALLRGVKIDALSKRSFRDSSAASSSSCWPSRQQEKYISDESFRSVLFDPQPSSNPLNFISNSYETGARFLCIFGHSAAHFRRSRTVHGMKKACAPANRDRKSNQINSFPMFSRSEDSSPCPFYSSSVGSFWPDSPHQRGKDINTNFMRKP